MNILVGVHSTIEGIVEIFAGIMGVTMGLYIMEAVLEALVVLGSCKSTQFSHLVSAPTASVLRSD